MSCGCNTPLETCNGCTPCNCCPPPDPAPLPVCPDPEPCDTALNSQCVMYTGGDLPCLGLTASGNPELIRLEDIIEAIEEAVCNSDLSVFITADTNCINLSGAGTLASPLTSTLIVDPNDDNLTECGATGVITLLYTESTDSCVTLAGAGTAADPLTAEINLGTGLLCTDGELSVDTSIIPVYIVSNGLTESLYDIQLGGPLIKDTTITLDTFYLSLESSPNDIFRVSPTVFSSTFTNGNNASSFVTRVYEDYDQFNVFSHDKLSEISGAYWSKGYLGITGSGTTNNSVLGAYYPTNGTTFESPYTSYFRAAQANVQARSHDVTLNLATNLIDASTSISYQTLVTGKKYIITTAGGVFTASGASSNAAGTVFTYNNVPPTWGTGAVRPYGAIVERSSPYFRSEFDRLDWVKIAYFDDDLGTRVPSVNDYMSIQTVNNYRIENQIMSFEDRFDDFQYYAKGIMSLNNNKNDLTSLHFAVVGVDFPTCTGAGCSLPALPDVNTSSYTVWRSDGDGGVLGEMDTISPFIYFRGVAGVLGGYAYVGINNSAPTTFLDIDGSNGAANFRIREDYAPATSGDSGNKGDITWGIDGVTSYVYVCVATNTWRRVAMSSF